mmetsp:Transcript_1712/g.3372  ORF Transcript_1712/g.3372 Transcript_1712/m.3372 type:complete len:183 (-) Transcript_1712:354-902(-)
MFWNEYKKLLESETRLDPSLKTQLLNLNYSSLTPVQQVSLEFDSPLETSNNKSSSSSDKFKTTHSNIKVYDKHIIKEFDNNLVFVSPTGSGKTLAFILPFLQHNLRQKLYQEQVQVQSNSTQKQNQSNTSKISSISISIPFSSSSSTSTSTKLQCLIVTPTRELANEIHQICLQLNMQSILI